MRIGNLIIFCIVTGLVMANDYSIEQVGQIRSNKIKEASGLAFSRRNPNCLWVINDSGAKPDVHGLNLNGKRLGRIRITDTKNRDWEDMAIFEKDSQSFLLIADVGDNRAVHQTNQLIFISEPDIKIFAESKKYSVKTHARMTFVYEDGPRDCEAIAVDEQAQMIYLISKRTYPPVLYVLPLVMENLENSYVAKQLSPMKGIPQPSMADVQEDPKFGQFCNQPTAMDILNNKMFVLTYKRLFIYERSIHGSWADAVQQKPHCIQFPSMKQAEALCVNPEEGSLFITSEGKKPPIYKISFP